MKKLNTVFIPIRWVDMDSYQHVNNALFFDYMTEARAQLLQELKTTDLSLHFVVVDTACNFKKPYIYPDTIIVEQYLEKIGHASFLLRYLFKSEKHSEILFAEGHAKMVCYDPKLKKAVGLPESVLKILNH